MITEDIDLTLEAIFAGDEQPNLLLRHHYDRQYKREPDTFSTYRILTDGDRYERLHLIIEDFVIPEPDRYPRRVKNGMLDDMYDYNDLILDDVLNCYYNVFDEYPVDPVSGDPWIAAFGLGVNCDRCGVKLDFFNKASYGLCNDCTHQMKEEDERFVL